MASEVIITESVMAPEANITESVMAPEANFTESAMGNEANVTEPVMANETNITEPVMKCNSGLQISSQKIPFYKHLKTFVNHTLIILQGKRYTLTCVGLYKHRGFFGNL